MFPSIESGLLLPEILETRVKDGTNLLLNVWVPLCMYLLGAGTRRTTVGATRRGDGSGGTGAVLRGAVLFGARWVVLRRAACWNLRTTCFLTFTHLEPPFTTVTL